jgi:hypothetical protein
MGALIAEFAGSDGSFYYLDTFLDKEIVGSRLILIMG